jgi:hypothetical protein
MDSARLSRRALNFVAVRWPAPRADSSFERVKRLAYYSFVRKVGTAIPRNCRGDRGSVQLNALASPRQQIEVASWSKQWKGDQALILPNWYPEGQITFGMLQYSNLDEQQFKAKLSQLPRGTKLYFQIWKPGQISPPVSIEKQEAVFQTLRSFAAQCSVTIEPKSDP